ncbi:unnamed protein product [Spirodela intermedia]|uniref:Cyclin-like domain-containing protein n=1 Tax=Spirodela intermedia TaxID=51605 RepID=A0A7I8KRT8_SPIIN|nr:unnamed protein product [Spirodela intermedia]
MWEKDFDGGSQHWNPGAAVRHCSDGPSTSNSSFLHVTTAGWVAAKRDPDCRFFNTDLDAPSTRSQANLEDTVVFMSRDELEHCSPSRKDGINHLRETHLRYSYCAFLQNLGIQLNLPQTTIGTAMVLCHRFFVRRSHACHDRFLIATAALFLAAKSEETPCPLNTVLRVSWEICEKHNPAVFQCLLPIDWFEQYRESVIGAEHMILTTLNFELDVQHPYTPLKSVLHKLGLSQSVLLNLALNLINEGLRSSLWLQFKPHHIAAGAAFLAAQFLNLDLAYYQGIWHEFQTTPSILQGRHHLELPGSLKCGVGVSTPSTPLDYNTIGDCCIKWQLSLHGYFHHLIILSETYCCTMLMYMDLIKAIVVEFGAPINASMLTASAHFVQSQVKVKKPTFLQHPKHGSPGFPTLSLKSCSDA